MPIVQMPDGTSVEMPDNPTPEQLTALKSVMDGGSPNPMAEAGRVADKAIRGGLTSAPGLAMDAGSFGMGGLMDIAAKVLPDSLVPEGLKIPDKSKFGADTKFIQTLGGIIPPLSQPQTETGKSIASIAEPVISTMAGGGVGSMGSKALTGLASGIGGEGAAKLFGDNILTRTLGGLAGGVTGSAINGVRSNADSLIKQSTEHMTAADWRRAEAMRKVLAAQGIPALASQTMGPRSTLADVVGVAGTNPGVRPKLVSAAENSSQKAKEAFDRFTMSNLPVSVSERPQVLDDIQGAAEKAVDAIKGKARGAYGAAVPAGLVDSSYTPTYVEALKTELSKMARDSSKFGPTTEGGRALEKFAKEKLTDPATGELITNKGYINNLYKELNTTAMQDGYKGLPLAELKKTLRSFTPEFQPARDAYSSVLKTDLSPVQKGLTGQIAQQGGGVRPDKMTAKDTAMALVFPVDKPQPQAIVELSKQIGGDGVGQLLRENLSRSMERATTLKPTADSLQSPYEFVKAVAGTNAQRQNLEAALKVTAESQGMNPAAVRNGFYKLMKAFESTKDLKLPSNVDKASLSQSAGQTVPGFMVAPQSRVARALWERATAKTYNRIANLVIAPDGLKQLEAIARSPDPELARQFAIGVLTTAGAGEEKTD